MVAVNCVSVRVKQRTGSNLGYGCGFVLKTTTSSHFCLDRDANRFCTRLNTISAPSTISAVLDAVSESQALEPDFCCLAGELTIASREERNEFNSQARGGAPATDFVSDVVVIDEDAELWWEVEQVEDCGCLGARLVAGV